MGPKEFAVLKTLASIGPLAGTDIAKKASTPHGGAYVRLKRMADKSWITKELDKEGRWVYSITSRGEKAMAAQELMGESLAN